MGLPAERSLPIVSQFRGIEVVTTAFRRSFPALRRPAWTHRILEMAADQFMGVFMRPRHL